MHPLLQVTDDFIGRAIISLARVRENGSDSVHAPVISKSGKQHGFVSVRLVFTPSDKKSGSEFFPGAYRVCLVARAALVLPTL